jgi:hypothetical protein
MIIIFWEMIIIIVTAVETSNLTKILRFLLYTNPLSIQAAEVCKWSSALVRGKEFAFRHPFTPALVPIQSPDQRLPGHLPLGIKQPNVETSESRASALQGDLTSSIAFTARCKAKNITPILYLYRNIPRGQVPL